MKKLASIALSAAVLTLWAGPVSAQAVDMNASLTAMCGGETCSTMKFLLELDGNATVDYLELLSHTNTWEFGRLVAVLDSSGRDIPVRWISGSHPTQFSLYFMADSSPEPITLLVDMIAWGSSDQLGDKTLSYFGQGFNEAGHLATYEGIAVPEPSTMVLLLLATLCFGAFFAVRRDWSVAPAELA